MCGDKPSASASWTLNVFDVLTKGGSKQAREKKRCKLSQNKCTTHRHSPKLNYYCVLSILCRIIFSSHATHLHHFCSEWLRNVWLGYSSSKEMRRFVVLVLSMRSPEGIHHKSMLRNNVGDNQAADGCGILMSNHLLECSSSHREVTRWNRLVVVGGEKNY